MNGEALGRMFAAMAEDEGGVAAQVRRRLVEARWSGLLDFDSAWEYATRGLRLAGWQSEAEGESPLDFLRRQLRAAWDDEPGQRYCQHPAGCDALTYGRLCPVHDPAVALDPEPVPMAPQKRASALRRTVARRAVG